jgi:hypothetical protein
MMQIWFVSGDDVVPYKFGDKSSRALSSSGFQDVTFKSYNGYVVGDSWQQKQLLIFINREQS